MQFINYIHGCFKCLCVVDIVGDTVFAHCGRYCVCSFSSAATYLKCENLRRKQNCCRVERKESLRKKRTMMILTMTTFRSPLVTSRPGVFLSMLGWVHQALPHLVLNGFTGLYFYQSLWQAKVKFSLCRIFVHHTLLFSGKKMPVDPVYFHLGIKLISCKLIVLKQPACSLSWVKGRDWECRILLLCSVQYMKRLCPFFISLFFPAFCCGKTNRQLWTFSVMSIFYCHSWKPFSNK